MTRLEEIEARGRNYGNAVDILAMEARIQQLEEALSRCNRWAFRPGEDWPASGHDRYEKDMELVDKALSTPAPNVSPLWDLLAATVRLYEKGKGLPWGHPDVLWDGALQKWASSNNALTPELRALIEKMGGWE